jgi:hypothetical protein
VNVLDAEDGGRRLPLRERSASIREGARAPGRNRGAAAAGRIAVLRPLSWIAVLRQPGRIVVLWGGIVVLRRGAPGFGAAEPGGRAQRRSGVLTEKGSSLAVA